MKNKIFRDMIEESPETELLKLIYLYSPPSKPTAAVIIRCQMLGDRIEYLNEASLEEEGR